MTKSRLCREPGCLTVKDLAREVSHGQCRLETDEVLSSKSWASDLSHRKEVEEVDEVD